MSDNVNSESRKYCENFPQQCTQCDSVGCNREIPNFVPNPLSCVKCDSNTDSNCIDLQPSTNAIQCGGATGEIVSGHTDSCFTYVSDSRVQRGCLSEFEELKEDCATNPEKCSLCPNNNCNRDSIEPEHCYECDSETDPNCRANLNSSMEVACPFSVTKMGCYRFDDGGEYFFFLPYFIICVHKFK